MKKEYELISLLFLFTVFLTISSASAANIYVNSTGGNDSANGTSWQFAKQTIQGGLGSTSDGDTLNLANGVYSGINNTNITINKNLTILGQNTIGTIINGEHVNWLLNIANNVNVTLENLTLTQGKNAAHGWAIYNTDGSIKVVQYSGAAIYNNDGSCTVIGCSFINNTSNEKGAIFNYPGSYGLQFNGGAINNDNGGTCTLTDCNFINNTAYWGGAIYSSNGGLIVNGSTFTNNNAQYNGGAIYDDICGNCSVIGSTFTNNTAIQYGDGGAVCNRAGTCVVTGSTFINNKATQFGGAIYNDGGTLNLSGSTFISNTSPDGAIFNGGINCSMTGSTFTNNTASNVGGAITNLGPCIVSGCTFTNNTATKYGGAIANAGPCNVISSTFTGNIAGIYGSAIFNDLGNVNVTFCRIVGNTLNTCQIYGVNGTTHALYDWWGSNSNPSVYVNSNVNATIWMVLRIKANPSTILNGSKSVITANLFYDNLNTYHDPGSGHVPDGILMTLTGTLGNLSLKSTSLSNGVANSTFTATSGGLATISAKVDNQTVNTKITVTLPAASANIPSGVYNTTQKIALSMKNASIIYYTTNGLNPTTASTRYTVPINITISTTLKFLAVDLAGNKSPVYTDYYKIDKIPPKITSTTPANNAKNVSLTTPVTIKFSKNISKGVNFSKIYIKNISTGKIAKSTVKSLNGNIITIKMTMSRLSLNNYQIVIPTGSVKDTAGNINSIYKLNFKTSKY